MEYYMFHKPKGCITAVKDEMHKTVMDYFQGVSEPGLHPVGRLDKETEGLLLITNDGKWNQELMHPDHHVTKTYLFWALGELSQEKIRQIENGIPLRGMVAKPAQIQLCDTKTLGDIMNLAGGIKVGNRKEQPVFSGTIGITEGKKHQVRRMLKAVGCYVVYLKRIAIGGLTLDETLQPGEYRKLTEEEKRKIWIKEKG
ncbi:MAG: 16S rRNA pseudouridine(516) synthase [Clostridiales bacterium]|nr:pseudouridine synthase [Eubacterium sp.]MDD5993881.1 16S rRNA pseudouridine(516) synthase [Clostridiales bacterium]MDD7350351.1 16S rRNA pseudouridine(516) synthase [Clostridiales bacterium]MDY3774906.1 16S rRNA pseudouridine(516) synthase [Eubacterium sp.]